MTEHTVTITVTDNELERMRNWVAEGSNTIDDIIVRRILDAAPKPIKVGDYVSPRPVAISSWSWQVRHIDTDGRALCRSTDDGETDGFSDLVLDHRKPSEFNTTWSDANPIGGGDDD